MAPPTFASAIVAGTAANYRTLLLLSLAANGSQVSGWSTGAPQRAFLDGESRALASESEIVAALAATASPSTVTQAGSTWVDAVMGWFDLDNGSGGKGRIPASFAVWEIPLKCTVSASPITITSASQIQLQSTGGVIFLCTQPSDIILNAGSSYKGTARFTARTAGTTGNVSPGQITKVISGPAGLTVDTGETQVRTTTARNAESDADFIARGLGRWGTIGPAWTLVGFNYYIPLYGNVPLNDPPLAVTRWSVDDSNPFGPGTVGVWLANAAGPASADEVAAVQAGLDSPSVHPLGSGALTCLPSVERHLTIAITINCDGSNVTAGAQSLAAVEALITAFPIGPAQLSLDLITAVARGSSIEEATIPTGIAGESSEVITLNLPGFLSVEQCIITSIVGGISLLAGEVYTASVVITVT